MLSVVLLVAALGSLGSDWSPSFLGYRHKPFKEKQQRVLAGTG